MVTDANGVTATKTYTLTVNAAPTITPATLPAATDTEVYSQTLVANGGTTPLGNWSLSSGILPAGLTLAPSTGVISGTVTGVTENFTVKITDANGISATKTYTLTVNAAPTITPASLPGATLTGAYNQTLVASGGTAPFGSWTLLSGGLPAGLTLNLSTGAITGTVTGTSDTFTVEINDANGIAATKTYTLTVNAAPTITPSSLPGATLTRPYSQTLGTSGGTAPFGNWSLSSGILPTGLTLAPSTGVISGTVTTGVTENFTVSITDANGVVATMPYTLTVNAKIAITTLSMTLTKSQSANVTIATTGGTPAFTWSKSAGTLPAGLTLSTTAGTITGTPTGSASYNFTIKVVDANGSSTTQNYTGHT
jgi:hypothetical protein